MDIRITPSPLTGCYRAASSKSDAHRLLICAALADKPTKVVIPHRSADIDATADCLVALGADITYSDSSFFVTPIRMATSCGNAENPTGQPDPIKTLTPVLDCAESGSTLRFLLPVAAALYKNVTFNGRGRLPKRPLEDLVAAMRAHGTECGRPHIPFTTSGLLCGGTFHIAGNVSSQYISGLLFALPLIGGGSVILTSPLESAAYVDMTISSMKIFGVDVIRTESGYTIPKHASYRSPGNISAEGDWSNAAFFLAAGAIGGNIRAYGLNAQSPQGDRKIFELLTSFGAKTGICNGVYNVSAATLGNLNIDLKNIPDLLPILAICAAYGSGQTVFYNGGRLRIKESDRLFSTASLINSIGGIATETADGLKLTGRRPSGGIVDGCGDHRIVMAAAVAGTCATGPVIIKGAHAVSKSYPTFFDDFRALGGRAKEV